MKSLFKKKLTKYNSIYLKVLIYLIVIFKILSEECEQSYPFRRNGNCESNGCTVEEFELGNCYIDNSIISTQWFNNIISISEIGFNYVDIVTTSNKDLIIITNTGSIDEENKYKRNFYGIKSDGHKYYIGPENYEETTFYQFTTNNIMAQGNIFSIKLKESADDKEYIIGISPNNFEIYDLDNLLKYEKSNSEIFGLSSIIQYRGSIIKLENNNYVLGIIGTNSDNNHYFYLVNIAFNSINIELNNPVISLDISYESSSAKIVSCFETDSKKIICFYQDKSYNYVLIAFNHDLNFILKETVANGLTNEDNYFECVHFIGETGAFGYFDNSNSDFLYIKFKKLNQNNTISNHFTTINEVSIKYKIFTKSLETNAMVKLDDLKICYVAFYDNGLKDMCLVIINSYTEEKVIVKYFTSHFYQYYYCKFSNELRITLFNGFIAMVSSYIKQGSYHEYPFLIIFGYPNSIDFNVDISTNLETFTNVEIDLNSKGKIDNNIFGYIFNGTKIIGYSNGLKLKSNLRSEINERDILVENENLILILDKETNILKDSKIIYAMVVTLPTYEMYDKYRELKNLEYEGNMNGEKNYYESQRKPLIGRNSYCNIVINEEILSSTDCDINCERCLKNGEKTCINCRYSYEIDENANRKICLDYNGGDSEKIIETTIITTQPATTIITTQPATTIITTQPATTLITTLPETTIITSQLETTIITTLPETTIITTQLETRIITTQPATTLLTTQLETTIIKTQPATTLITTQPATTLLTTQLETTLITTQPATTIITTQPATTIITTQPETTKITTQPESNKITTQIESNIPTISTETEYNKEVTDNPTIQKIDSTNLKEENVKENSCSNDDIKNNKCGEGKISINQLNDIKKELLNNNYIQNKTNTIIKTENVVVQLSTSKEQKNSDIPDVSNIDLGQCEDLLKSANNIPESESLIIFKTDIKSEDLSATYVQYEVYNPIDLIKLDLDICKDVEITINVPVNLNSSIESIFDSLSQSGYNLFNENDSFYQDICATYTTLNGTDIILADRKKDIYSTGHSLSMCQIGCELKSYNSTSKKANCDCAINQNEVKDLNVENLFGEKEISENFYKTLTNSNFQVLKCYKLIISFDLIKKNLGELIMASIFVIFFILLIISCIGHHNKIQSYISLALHRFIFDKSKERMDLKNNRNNKKRASLDPKLLNKNKNHQILERKYSKKLNPRSSLNVRKSNKTRHSTNLEQKKNKIKRLSSKKQTYHNPPKNKVQKNNTKKTKIIKSDNDHFIKKSFRKHSNSLIKINNDNSSINNIYNVKKSKRNGFIKYKDLNNEKTAEKKFPQLNQIKKNKTIKKLDSQRILINNDNLKDNNLYQGKSLNDAELNNLTYELALQYDKRTYFQYYWSLLKKKQLILFAFLPSNDYNLNTIKISLLLLSFSLYFTVNGFFFSDATMHKVYEDKGGFDILYQVPQLLYSTMVSSLINIILKTLSLSERNIIEIKEQNDIEKARIKSKEVESCIKLKFAIFFILSIILMLFFSYFISCFCAVYTNTQIILIKDTLISFGLSMLYPFGLNLFPGFFRIPALRSKNKDKPILYKFSLIIALI